MMRKTGWNSLVFFACLAVDAVFCILYWTVFISDTAYARYYPFCWHVFCYAQWVNIGGQLIAIFRRKWIGIAWILFAVAAFFAAVISTIGMSV